MPETADSQTHNRPLGDILLEMKRQFIDLVATRIRIFRAEFDETKQSLKGSVPLLMGAAVFLGTAYLLLVGAVVFLLSVVFIQSSFRWFFAFLIVGVVWAIVGAVFAGLARNQLRTRGTFPRKTMEVLKADGLWLRDEVKNPL